MNIRASLPSDTQGFRIGELANLVGVSPHVIRSWERRLSLRLGHRTISNQRRYGLRDVRQVVAIKRLRDQQGLRLTDAAAIALAETDSAPDDGPPAPGIESATLQSAWAALLDTVPTLLLVIDENGRVIGANRAARQTLPVRRGSRFETLAPPGWRPILRRISGESNSSRQVNLQLRTSGGTMSMRGVVAGRTPRRNFVILSGSQHPPTPSAGQSASPESSPGIPRPHAPSQP